MMTPKEVMESEEYQLERQATALKKAGDWNGAIAALRQVKALQGHRYQSTRLAKYLQQAGHLDDAMQEIAWLVEHSQQWAAALFAHQPASVLQRQRFGWLVRVHGDAVLICKRAKRTDLQAEHESKKIACAALLENLKPLAEADRKKVFKDYEAARKKGLKALLAFFAERLKRIKRDQQ